MAITFPTTLDTLTNPTATTDTATVSHADQHSNANDAIEALEAKVGVNSSAVTSTLDYKLTNTSSSNPGHKHTLANGATDVTASAAELNFVDGVTSAIQTQLDTKITATSSDVLTNKTLTAPKVADGGFIADVSGNELLEFDSNATAVNHLRINNAAANNEPGIEATGGDTDVSFTMSTKGDGQVEFYKNNYNTALAYIKADGDVDLRVAGANILVQGSNPKKTITVPASAMFPSTTAGCASLAQVESATNKVNIKVLDFDGAGSSKEYAEFGFQSPSNWDAGTVTAQFVWYASAGSGTVNWEIQGLALSDDDALDAAYGTLQEVTDTLLAIGDKHITSETSAVTIAGSPVAGDWLQFRVARDPANDNNTSDARLAGVRIRYGITKYSDE